MHHHLVLLFATLVQLFVDPTSAHPIPDLVNHVGRRIMERSSNVTTYAPEFKQLLDGNLEFRKDLKFNNPGLMENLATVGQQPPFMIIGCADSRVGEGTVFNADPGVFFSERNIANQFLRDDVNSQSVLAYAVSQLRVKHIIVMGHYGCGGVAAATMKAPKAASRRGSAAGMIQNWINPVRAVYATSTRPEVVEMRRKNKSLKTIVEPELLDPGFRALVEENVKVNVNRLAESRIITEHYSWLADHEKTYDSNSTVSKRSDHPDKPPAEVFIHGWVYDIENGQIIDLGVSIGPPGKPIPASPFSHVSFAEKGPPL